MSEKVVFYSPYMSIFRGKTSDKLFLQVWCWLEEPRFTGPVSDSYYRSKSLQEISFYGFYFNQISKKKCSTILMILKRTCIDFFLFDTLVVSKICNICFVFIKICIMCEIQWDFNFLLESFVQLQTISINM